MKTALPMMLVLFGGYDRPANDNHPAPAASFVERLAAPPAASILPPTLAQAPGKGRYVCPMHPEVTSDQPGLCPKCNMKLELKPKAAEVRPADGRAEAPSWPCPQVRDEFL